MPIISKEKKLTTAFSLLLTDSSNKQWEKNKKKEREINRRETMHSRSLLTYLRVWLLMEALFCYWAPHLSTFYLFPSFYLFPIHLLIPNIDRHSYCALTAIVFTAVVRIHRHPQSPVAGGTPTKGIADSFTCLHHLPLSLQHYQ